MLVVDLLPPNARVHLVLHPSMATATSTVRSSCPPVSALLACSPVQSFITGTAELLQLFVAALQHALRHYGWPPASLPGCAMQNGLMYSCRWLVVLWKQTRWHACNM